MSHNLEVDKRLMSLENVCVGMRRNKKKTDTETEKGVCEL